MSVLSSGGAWELESSGGSAAVARAAKQRVQDVRAVQLAVMRGVRDEGKLTAIVFFARHPERRGRPIQKSEPALAKEWIAIRDTVVRRVLGSVGAKGKPVAIGAARKPWASKPPGKRGIATLGKRGIATLGKPGIATPTRRAPGAPSGGWGPSGGSAPSGGPAPSDGSAPSGGPAPSSDGGPAARGTDGGPHREAFLAVAPVQIGEATLTADWLEKTLHGVIANRGQAKRWNDLLALDGGTVGIAHFAKGGLRTLHREMDAPRYFGRDAASIPADPYSQAFWRDGMQRFFASPECHVTQVRAWVRVVDGGLQAAAGRGWRTPRGLAIAAGISNSMGAGGFNRLATTNGWDPERTLRAYAALSAHKSRRAGYIDREFPR